MSNDTVHILYEYMKSPQPNEKWCQLVIYLTIVCLQHSQQLAASPAVASVPLEVCSADCLCPGGCGKNPIQSNQINSSGCDDDWRKQAQNTYLIFSCSTSASFTCPCGDGENPYRWLTVSTVDQFLKSQTDKVCPTWLLSSSFLFWLASSSELMEATCCTSWLFSACVSSSWAVRASTWAERSLISASNLSVRAWNSSGIKEKTKQQSQCIQHHKCPRSNFCFLNAFLHWGSNLQPAFYQKVA